MGGGGQDEVVTLKILLLAEIFPDPSFALTVIEYVVLQFKPLIFIDVLVVVPFKEPF